MKTSIVYYPPPVEAVEACVRNICRELGQGVDETFNTPEVIWGFTAFINISNTIAAHQLNQTVNPARAGCEIDTIPEPQ